MLTVPPAILDLLHWHAGATVGLTVERGRLVVEPYPRPHYGLDELLAQCDASAEIGEEDRAWLDGKPVGRELLQWNGAIFTWYRLTRLKVMNSREHAPSWLFLRRPSID